MKRLLLFLTMALTLFGVSRADTQEVTPTSVDQTTVGSFTISYAQNSGTTAPAYNGGVRLYYNSTKGCSITIKANDPNIILESVTFTCTGTSYTFPNTAVNAGEGIMSTSGTTSTWTAPSGSEMNEISLYNTQQNNNQVRFTKFVITYSTKTGGGSETTPTDAKLSFVGLPSILEVGKSLDLSDYVKSEGGYTGEYAYGIEGDAYASLDGSVLTGRNAGSVTIKASIPASITNFAGSATADILISTYTSGGEDSNPGTSKTVTYDSSSKGYGNQTAISTVTEGEVTIEFSKGSNNSNSPTYYTSGTAIRMYPNNYFKVSVDPSKYLISKISIVFGTSDGSLAITTDKETFASPSWTGSASDVTFTIANSNSGNRRIVSIDVTYAPIGTIEPEPEKTQVTLTYSDQSATADLNDLTSFTAPTLTVEPNEAAGAITYDSSNPAVATIGNDGKVSIEGEGETKITASISGNEKYEDASASYILTVTNNSQGGEEPNPSAGNRYVLVEDQQIENGALYVIAYTTSAGTSYSMGLGTNKIPTKEVAISNNVLTVNENTLILKAEQNGNNWNWKVVNEGQYNGNYMVPGSKTSYLQTNAGSTTVSFNQDNAVLIANTGNTTYTLMAYNNQDFRGYENNPNNGSVYPNLFKQVLEGPGVTPVTLSFAKEEIKTDLNVQPESNSLSIKNGDEDLTETLAEYIVYSVNEEGKELVTISEDTHSYILNYNTTGKAKITATLSGTEEYSALPVSFEYIVVNPDQLIDVIELTSFTDPAFSNSYGYSSFKSDITDITYEAVAIANNGNLQMNQNQADRSKDSGKNIRGGLFVTSNPAGLEIEKITVTYANTAREIKFYMNDEAYNYGSLDNFPLASDIEEELYDTKITGTDNTLEVKDGTPFWGILADSGSATYITKIEVLYKQDSRELPGLEFNANKVIVKVGDEFPGNELSKVTTMEPTFTSSRENVAEVDPNSGKVTLKGKVGETKITASVEGNEVYQGGSESYIIVVEPADVLSVAEALEAIENGYEGTAQVSGIVIDVDSDSLHSTQGTMSYTIRDTEDEGKTILVYEGLWLNGNKFENEGELKEGDELTVEGYLVNYNGDTPEITDSQVIAYDGETILELSFEPAAITVKQGEVATLPILVIKQNGAEVEKEVADAIKAIVEYTVEGDEGLVTVAEDKHSVTINTNIIGSATVTASITQQEDSKYVAEEASYTITVYDANHLTTEITWDSFGLSQANGSYDDYTLYFPAGSDEETAEIIYKINVALPAGTMQFRSSTTSGKNIHSGLVVSKNDIYRVKSVKVEWNEASTMAGTDFSVYTNSDAYNHADDLYSSEREVPAITKTATEYTDFDGIYPYIGLRSKSGAMQIDKITIEWEKLPTVYMIGTVERTEWDENNEVSLIEMTGENGVYTLTKQDLELRDGLAKFYFITKDANGELTGRYGVTSETPQFITPNKAIPMEGTMDEVNPFVWYTGGEFNITVNIIGTPTVTFDPQDYVFPEEMNLIDANGNTYVMEITSSEGVYTFDDVDIIENSAIKGGFAFSPNKGDWTALNPIFVLEGTLTDGAMPISPMQYYTEQPNFTDLTTVGCKEGYYDVTLDLSNAPEISASLTPATVKIAFGFDENDTWNQSGGFNENEELYMTTRQNGVYIYVSSPKGTKVKYKRTDMSEYNESNAKGISLYADSLIPDDDEYYKDADTYIDKKVVWLPANSQGNLSLKYVNEDKEIETIPMTYAFKVVKGETTDIDSIDAEAEGEVEYYTLDGLKVNAENLQNGLYIVKKGNKVVKAMIRK